MSTSPIQTVELSGVEPLHLGPGVCPTTSGNQNQVASSEAPEINQRKEILAGKDALEFLRNLRSAPMPAPPEKQIDIKSLEQALARRLPQDNQLTRRARKLAWQMAKGRQLDYDWAPIFLSELTTEEKSLTDAEFAALYPDDPKPAAKRGGRPRKYSTPAEEKKGHAECQRRYRTKRQNTVEDVTKTPSPGAQLFEIRAHIAAIP